ncbi:nitroreductase family protein [Dysgonomonas sp. ZJ279]|uniref:nitroreductase family protein n=1 Tax=Dysgonomonas sp. ZJ279 TaxID=2709796 RepID=UPI0013EAF2D3|nr:nitroreductase family protein [Dysgonomonas sp. ZJ279]
MKKRLIKILPYPMEEKLRKLLNTYRAKKAFLYDHRRYKDHSATTGYNTEEKLRARIMMVYHIAEKGLTMPIPRLGFGQENIFTICRYCEEYFTKYNRTNHQVLHAVAVLQEYLRFHERNNYELDKALVDRIGTIKGMVKDVEIMDGKQIMITSEEYFKEVKSDFKAFSNSRKSVRSYSESEIPIELINSSIEMANNTPSACNRQTARVHVYTKKEDMQKILGEQNGNRGFGHLADKIIVVTAELGVFSQAMERNQAYIDGGMYLMNLLYTLHYNKIAVCTLNCSHTPTRDKVMRNLCKIKESEVFIAILACGMMPEEASIALSPRYGCTN